MGQWGGGAEGVVPDVEGEWGRGGGRRFWDSIGQAMIRSVDCSGAACVLTSSSVHVVRFRGCLEGLFELACFPIANTLLACFRLAKQV